MGLFDLARKLLNRFTTKHDRLFTYSVEQQQQFLNELPTVKNDIERSRNQYLAQKELTGKLRSLIYNVACLVVYYFQKRKYVKNKFGKEQQFNLVYHVYGADHTLLPESIQSEFSSYLFYSSDDTALNNADLNYIKKIKKQYRHSYYFLSKIMAKMAIYRAIIQKHQPKAIATCSEYSFTGSVLTEWLEEQNIEHINLMHGEKLFYMRDSFARFSRYYVWDEFYITLLTKLKMPAAQFIVEIPPSLKLKTDVEKSVKSFDLTYYLANETDQELTDVVNSMLTLKSLGWRVCLRAHPRYTDIKYIEKHCPHDMLEENGTSLDDSLTATKAACSLYSTVLQQAWAKGLKIVIDDVKDKEKYIVLKGLDYIMYNRSHMLLSELLRVKK